MFLQGYFYWCGVVINVIAAFWLLVGVYVVGRNWFEEGKIRKKYARREVKK